MALWKGSSGVTPDLPLACGGGVDFGWSSSIIMRRAIGRLTDKGREALCHVLAGSAAVRGSVRLAGTARNTKEPRAP